MKLKGSGQVGEWRKTLRTVRTVEEKESNGLEGSHCSGLRLSRTVSGAVSDPLDRLRDPHWRNEAERRKPPRPPGSQGQLVAVFMPVPFYMPLTKDSQIQGQGRPATHYQEKDRT